MIEEDKCRAILILYQEGKKKKEIARLLHIAPKTVRKIIKNDGKMFIKIRCNKKTLDPDLLLKIYERCKGYRERILEVLKEEYNIEIGYSTLTRRIREHGFGQKINQRCHQVPDMPGQEMQHDTSPYQLKIGNSVMRLNASGLYLRYCKMRYIQFYPVFNRFRMKSFFYEALSYWKYTAPICVIDNTNLAVLHGTGKDAIFNREMIDFAKPYGFQWLAHEKGHSNRKAGIEKNFHVLETNFFPGRTFESIEDLNQQAFEWSTNRYAHRPLSKTGLIPIRLFEEEKSYLNELPSYLPPPYREHHREIDQYGYIAFNANYYWIPGTTRCNIKIVEYSNKIKCFETREKFTEYALPPWGTKNKKITPEGINTNPYLPKNQKLSCEEEEKKLRAMGNIIEDYIDFIRSRESKIKQKPKFIRDLYRFSLKLSKPLFTKTVERGVSYRVTSIDALFRIASHLLKKNLYPIPDIDFNQDYENRKSYQEGRFSEEPDLFNYKKILDETNESGH